MPAVNYIRAGQFFDKRLLLLQLHGKFSKKNGYVIFVILSSFPSDLRNYSQPAILYMQGFELVTAVIPGEMFFSFFPGLIQNAEATQVLTNISPIPTTSVTACYEGKNLSFGQHHQFFSF